MRSLTREERACLIAMAERLSTAERAQLLADVEKVTATDVIPDGSIVAFEIAGYARPPYRGQHTFGVEGRLLDRDGCELSVLLHADEGGRLLELELVRWGPGAVIEPNWSSLKLE